MSVCMYVGMYVCMSYWCEHVNSIIVFRYITVTLFYLLKSTSSALSCFTSTHFSVYAYRPQMVTLAAYVVRFHCVVCGYSLHCSLCLYICRLLCI